MANIARLLKKSGDNHLPEQDFLIKFSNKIFIFIIILSTIVLVVDYVLVIKFVDIIKGL